MRTIPAAAMAVLALLAPAVGARAQAAAAAPQNPLLEVGAVAPAFALPGSTRYGELQQPVRLSDYFGKTVVLAFFYRVRTPG